MRGKRAKKSKIQPDYKYNSELVSRFINKIMQHGEKTKAEKLFYTAIEEGANSAKVEPMEFLDQVVNNIRPALEIKSRRVGGANYSVPIPVNPYRQETLVIRWMIGSTRAKSGASFSELLKREMLDAFNGAGEAMKKKEEVERMAEANKAFAHFRW